MQSSRKFAAVFSTLAVGLGLAHAAPVVSTNAAVSSSVGYYSQGGESFPVHNLIDGRFNDSGTLGNWSFWLAPNGANRAVLTLDLHIPYRILAVDVQDTHNRNYRDRGTRGFVISTSLDGRVYAPVVTDTFSPQEWQSLSVKHFQISTVGRYVRFEALSCWGCQSVGLNEIQISGFPHL
jgi:hypothetical protein